MFCYVHVLVIPIFSILIALKWECRYRLLCMQEPFKWEPIAISANTFLHLLEPLSCINHIANTQMLNNIVKCAWWVQVCSSQVYAMLCDRENAFWIIKEIYCVQIDAFSHVYSCKQNSYAISIYIMSRLTSKSNAILNEMYTYT